MSEQLNDYKEPETPGEQTITKKPKKGLVLFILACIFAVIAVVIDVYWLTLWVDIFPTLIGGSNDSTEVFAAIMVMVLLLPIMMISVPLASIISIVLSALSVKRFKVASLIMLSVVALLFLANLVLFIIFVANGNASESQSAFIMLGQFKTLL